MYWKMAQIRLQNAEHVRRRSSRCEPLGVCRRCGQRAQCFRFPNCMTAIAWRVPCVVCCVTCPSVPWSRQSGKTRNCAGKHFVRSELEMRYPFQIIFTLLNWDTDVT
uniref:Uncharacterized protein n=1 Tax=Parascaris univalens TaxID=6257 RepID=A0A914ZYH9_PARUN